MNLKTVSKLGIGALAVGALGVGAFSALCSTQVSTSTAADHGFVQTAYADALSWGNLPDGKYEAQWNGNEYNKYFGMVFSNPATVQVTGNTYTVTIRLTSGIQYLNNITVNGVEVWKKGDSTSSLSFTMNKSSNQALIGVSYSAGGLTKSHDKSLSFTITKVIQQTHPASQTSQPSTSQSTPPKESASTPAQTQQDLISDSAQADDDTRVIPELGIKRLAGETAADTMQAIVQAAFPTTRKTVVLTTNAAYFDALSANALAGALHAPVLLTDIDALPAQTRAELQRLKTKTVYVCGGSLVVSQAVENELTQMGIKVKRIFGDMADDTANKIASALPRVSDICFVTTSWGYADALSASSFAYAKRAPIFLARYDNACLSEQTLATIKNKGFKRVIIVGGTSVVSPEVENQLAQQGIQGVERIFGESSYDTSLTLAQKLLDMGLRANNMGVATGVDYLDALCGSALCGRYDSVIVLADDTNTSAVSQFMSRNRAAIKSYAIFGGTAAVGEATEVEIHRVLEQ